MLLKSTLSFITHAPMTLNSRNLRPLVKFPDLLLSMEKCIDDVKTWMTVNTLKLNDDTTEAMIVSSGRKSSSLSSSFPESVTIGSASVPTSDSVKNLGIRTDSHLTIKIHISNLVPSASFELSPH